MEAHTAISQGWQRACPPTLHQLPLQSPFFFLFPAHKSAISRCKKQDTLWRVTNSVETQRINFNKECIRTRTKVGRVVRGWREGERKRNKMGLRNIVKAFNRRRAVRPGFSPTGAKRQMGSITALAGHTHTTSIAISIKRTPQRGN